MKKWYESKVLWFNIVWLVVVVATLFGYDAVNFVPSDETKAIAEAIAALFPIAVNLYLRFVTNKAVTL